MHLESIIAVFEGWQLSYPNKSLHILCSFAQYILYVARHITDGAELGPLALNQDARLQMCYTSKFQESRNIEVAQFFSFLGTCILEELSF